MSATHNWSAPAAVKFRSTKSGAGRVAAPRVVVLGPRRRLAPSMPACFISRATRLCPTRTFSACNSAWMRGRPYTSRLALHIAVIRRNCPSRRSRADGSRLTHA